ncbi:MAG TPA: glycosyltransferase family 4 protein [Solirubrobacteraceae bacterium]|nr:glycosyltransferase family 4 protein [Solirubrobacteraceae bacterium]
MPAEKPLRIAWLGGAPQETGGAPGVVTELLGGLARRGHQIECFFPGSGVKLPNNLAEHENLTFVWGTSEWRWNRWYSRGKVASFATGLLSRAIASIRLRREIISRHRRQPYDVIYQNQTIESLGVPSSLLRSVPLVIRPDSHMAGELRCLIAERELAFRCQPRHTFFVVAAIMAVRAVVQRVKIRRASLLICISSVFRDHIVNDYGFPLEKTVVICNPERLDRFAVVDHPVSDPPIVLVPTRISVRKGVEDVVAVARVLRDRGVTVRIRVIGGPSTWSDYTKLLDDLPAENTEYGGRIPPARMPQEIEASDVVLLASKYDPCPMSVLEALTAGVPVVATSEVGSIEDIDRAVTSEVPVGDVDGLATAVTVMLDRLRENPAKMHAIARAEAERRFDPDVVCEQISDALERLVGADAEAPTSVRVHTSAQGSGQRFR